MDGASASEESSLHGLSQTSAQADIDGPYAWVRLLVSMVFATVAGVGMWSVIVVLPAIEADFGISRAEATLPYTTTMLGFAFGNAVVGRAVDRWSYWIAALVSAIVLSSGFAIASLTTSVFQFALVQGVMIGAGSAAGFGPLIADISHWFEKRRGIAVAIAASGNYLAGAIWPLIIPYFMDATDWRGTYRTIAVVSIVLMIPLVLLLRRGSKARVEGQASQPTQSSVFSPGAIQVMLIVAGLGCCVAMSMPQVHIVAYCMDLGYGVARGAEMLSLMLAGGVVSRLVSGLLADRIGGVRTLLLGSVLQMLSLLLYIPFDGLASLYIVSLVFGLSQGGIVPAYAVVIREYMPAHEAGARVGLVMMATVFGMALGGWISGWIYELTGSYTAAFVNGIAWNVLNALVILMLLLKSNRLAPARA
ncbi:MAG TPA: MFS transporter [Rhizobiaceae bacterium]|nr:MFS transporter [Rhizobiaceae bacterium]